MMSFDKYYFQRELWNKKLDEIEAKIDYRTIELVGHRVSVRTSVYRSVGSRSNGSKIFYGVDEREKNILDSDLVLQGLLRQRDEFLRRLDFITDRAEYLETTDEAVKSWEAWEESKEELFDSKDEERSTSE